jgi:hypothetical protein
MYPGGVMKSKLILILLIFSAFSIGLGVYNAKRNMVKWDQFEKEFQEKTFEMSKKTGFIRSAISEPVLSPNQESKEKNITEENANKNPQKPYQPTSQDPLNHISKEIQKVKSFQDLIDFQNDELDLVLESKDKAELANVSREVILQLSQCLKNKKCLEDKVSEDPNYEFQNTRSYQLLERALHTAIILSEESPRLSHDFSREMTQSVLDIQNTEIQNLGLELITTTDNLTDESFNYLLKKAPQLQPESRAVLFSQTERFTRGQDQKRSLYLNELKRELNRDAESAVEILKYLQFVKLSEQELVKVSKSLCQFYSSGKSQSLDAIEYHHSLYQSAKGHNISLKKMCQN